MKKEENEVGKEMGMRKMERAKNKKGNRVRKGRMTENELFRKMFKKLMEEIK